LKRNAFFKKISTLPQKARLLDSAAFARFNGFADVGKLKNQSSSQHRRAIIPGKTLLLHRAMLFRVRKPPQSKS